MATGGTLFEELGKKPFFYMEELSKSHSFIWNKCIYPMPMYGINAENPCLS